MSVDFRKNHSHEKRVAAELEHLLGVVGVAEALNTKLESLSFTAQQAVIKGLSVTVNAIKSADIEVDGDTGVSIDDVPTGSNQALPKQPLYFLRRHYDESIVNKLRVYHAAPLAADFVDTIYGQQQFMRIPKDIYIEEIKGYLLGLSVDEVVDFAGGSRSSGAVRVARHRLFRCLEETISPDGVNALMLDVIARTPIPEES